MKMKQVMRMVVLAMSAYAGAVYAQSVNSAYLSTNVRITSIVKSFEGSTPDALTTDENPTVTFQVTFKDTATSQPCTLEGASFTWTSTDARPYLVLNIPMSGPSSVKTPATGEPTSVNTTTAVAFFNGAKSNSDGSLTMDFVYTVRPGDMINLLAWSENTTTLAPIFGGAYDKITVSVQNANGQSYSGINLPTDCFRGKEKTEDGKTTYQVAADTATNVPVRGLTFTVGDDETNRNNGRLYQGLVPVTISRADSNFSYFTNANDYNNGAMWVETVSGDKKYYQVGVTVVNADGTVLDSTVINGGNGTTEDAINSNYAATKQALPRSTTKQYSWTYYLNIPQAIAAGTNLRLCWGVMNGAYTYADFEVEATPVTTSTNRYFVEGNVASTTFASAADFGEGVTLTDTPAYPVTGGTVTVAAGSTATVFVRKGASRFSDTNGTVYTALSRVSESDAANAKPSLSVIGLQNAGTDQDEGNGTRLTFTPGSTSVGTTVYKLMIPTVTGDQPYYLKVVTTPERASIVLALAADETGSNGSEQSNLMVPAEGETPAVRHYTLSVDKAKSFSRTFLIYPTDDAGNQLTTQTITGETDANGAALVAKSVIDQAIVVQKNGTSLSKTSKSSLVVTLPSNATTVDFYVYYLNDFVMYASPISDCTLSSGTRLSSITLSARTCDANGNVTGLSDETSEIQPVVDNVAPRISNYSAPTTGAAGAALSMNFTLTDVVTDYLVTIMNFGDGITQYDIYVNETTMKNMIGSTAWANVKTTLKQSYPALFNGDEFDTARVHTRTATGAENVVYNHTYTTSTASWSLQVVDSSRAGASISGTIQLTTSQTFTFFTYDKSTGGLGIIHWDRSNDGWNYGGTYTQNALARNGVKTVILTAIPLAVGETSPYTDLQNSGLYDSFFYKWAADTTYADLLPTNETLYDATISINRAYVKGGGQADDDSKWEDIVLKAKFIHEYASGDYVAGNAALIPGTVTTAQPYVLDLGDYNSDGVPDGWLLKNFGATEGRTMIESATTPAPATGDAIPAIGWVDGVYNSANRIGPAVGDFTATGAAFTYKMRLRGRDEALNAADGYGHWISHPQWIVAMRASKAVSDGHYAAFAGSVTETRDANNQVITTWTDAGYTQVKLATSEIVLNTKTGAVKTSGINFTENGVPYATTATQSNGVQGPATVDVTVGNVKETWAYVVDANGTILTSTPTTANAVGVMVCIASDNDANRVETFRSVYQDWCYAYVTEGGATSYHFGVLANDNQNQNVIYDPGQRSNPEARAALPAGADGATLGTDGFPTVRGIMYPFRSKAQMTAARSVSSTNYAGVHNIAGGNYEEAWDKTAKTTENDKINVADVWYWATSYTYSDERISNGMLLDEPFKMVKNDEGFYDPRLTSWLDRFPGSSADTDGDGLVNGVEYFFWYYASRIVYAPVKYTDGNQNVQIDTAIWPAIDMLRRTQINSNDAATSQFASAGVFSLGRSFTDVSDDGTINWAPIKAETVMAAFDCFGASGGDSDNDGLSNVEEIAAGLNPIDFDSDGDGMPDGWEIAMGTNPSANDANENPDNDAYASVELYSWATFHHAINLTYTYRAYGVATDVDAVYDYELDKVVYTIDGTTITEQLQPTRVNTWGEAFYREISGSSVVLKHHDVYTALGFNPLTGWTTGLTTNVGALGKFAGVAVGANTKAFTNIEEFRLGALLAYRRATERTIANIITYSPNPLSADTNGDGVPDGWAAYVGGCPVVSTASTTTTDKVYGEPNTADFYGDGSMTIKANFGCRAVNLIAASGEFHTSWTGLTQDAYNTWVNKLWPTDPWNADTDFDGIWDADEGNATFINNPSDTTWLGGGCNPTSPDTDADGIPDGWEWYYGRAVADVEDGTVASTLNPDPTNRLDYDTDPDGDGLTNFQEYMTQLFRQNRYDLGPDMARIYKDVPGTIEEEFDVKSWVRVPDIYNPIEDLGNPSKIQVLDYLGINQGTTDEPLYMPVYGHPLALALAQLEDVTVAYSEPNATAYRRNKAAAAVAQAFNRGFTKSYVLPNYDDMVNHGLVQARGAVNAQNRGNVILVLSKALEALDAAYLRYINTGSEARAYEVVGQVLNVDAALETVKTSLAAEELAKCFSHLANGKTSPIWVARRTQVLARVNDAFANGDSYFGTNGLLVDRLTNTYHVQTAPAATAPMDTEIRTAVAAYNTNPAAYEAAVAAETNPLIAVAYRAALRGFNGGLWTAPLQWNDLSQTAAVEDSRYNAVLSLDTDYGSIAYIPYFTNIGYHLPLIPFEKANAQATNFDALDKSVQNGRAEAGQMVLGASVEATDLGGIFPNMALKFNGFATTSPVISDTDGDGMDDYWEVFHGLNPILGDYKFDRSGETSSMGAEPVVDAIQAAYAGDDVNAHTGFSASVFASIEPENSNPFLNPVMLAGNITGYDYYTYPWLSGAPFADPDGDGLTNFEEAVNPNDSSPAHYGTDPSPLWMTDPDNVNSFATRFYGLSNQNIADPSKIIAIEKRDGSTDEYDEDDSLGYYGASSFGMQYIAPLVRNTTATGTVEGDGLKSVYTPTIGGLVEPFEINEGYDTDGDGISDLVELTNDTIFRGDPQTLRTPDRQQAAYLGGEGVLQSSINTQFGPTALHSFSLECWVKPETEQTDTEVILIDRPWRFDEGTTVATAQIRHNFQLGLRKDGTGFKPFVRFTGSATSTNSLGGSVTASPEAVSTEAILANQWAHLAATYNGSQLIIYVNGVAMNSATTTLIPANGVISLMNDGVNATFTYAKAPILIGATPKAIWSADVSNIDATEFTTLYSGLYKGFIDEVRIWNGARTAAEITASMRSDFTTAQLLSYRVAAFTARVLGLGYYERTVPAEPLAIYSFNDLLAGSKIAATEDAEATAATTPFERYPGEKLTAGETTPGNFIYRRQAYKASIASTADTVEAPANPLINATKRPKVEDLYTSFYQVTVPEVLRSQQYSESTDKKFSEFVPMAHNTVAHMPLMDVTIGGVDRAKVPELKNGTPNNLTSPSGDANHVKVADSVYWSPYAKGSDVSTTAKWDVKTTGNPYAARFTGTVDFDAVTYRTIDAYTLTASNDLYLYGDVFSKFDFDSWNSSPSTDPNTGDGSDRPTSDDWFNYVSGGTSMNGNQASNGGQWLEDNIQNGSTLDSDSDGMPNWWENYYGLDPLDATGSNGPHGDDDGDFLTNYAEYCARSNPAMYSTLGNGVPDYHMSIWRTRGRPTFGLLYTDNDFMEDHWEALHRGEKLTVDRNDGTLDADGDGWSNWAEARANFRSGEHSTDPNLATSVSMTGTVMPEYPRPTLRLKVDYFEDMTIVTNAENNIILHAFTATNNNSAPDAIFTMPLAVAANVTETRTQEIGKMRFGTTEGYLEPGNIKPGTFKALVTRYVEISDDTEGGVAENTTWTMRDDGNGNLKAAKASVTLGDDGEMTTTTVESAIGTINYTTGKYIFTYAREEFEGKFADGSSIEDSILTATYDVTLKTGFPAEYTLVTPTSGWLREGKNNFFAFVDLNGDGQWNAGEPAGVPDQHDVDIGFDTINDPLHVTLTQLAPPGSVRVDVGAILAQIKAAGDSGMPTPNPNDAAENVLNANDFLTDLQYSIVLSPRQTIASASSTTTEVPKAVFVKEYNKLKPYLTEDEIFAENASGLPGTSAANAVATSYNVYLVPSTVDPTIIGSNLSGSGSTDLLAQYNIAIVTNFFSRIDSASTKIKQPVGGATYHNTEMTFEWYSNTQMPSFKLNITQKENAAGLATSNVVYSSGLVRGVGAASMGLGTGSVQQYLYSYTLPYGIGDITSTGNLFGNGLYEYTLELQPYAGDAVVLKDTFRIALAESGAMTNDENATRYGAQDSYYLRTNVRYNGILATNEDFDYRKIRIEAHYSASFNGVPVASTSDFMVYNQAEDTEDNKAIVAKNPYVTVTKDKVLAATSGAGEFFSTLITAELRGLPDNTPVYLVAYFDLNGNGERDAWEPWGYATQGTASETGFYFDPLAVTPVNNGKDIQASFYIQDVDTDNDKLADCWEWLMSGRPEGDFSEWNSNFTGSASNHITDSDIWVTSTTGKRTLTALGAQLYGVTVKGESDANGAVTIEGLGTDAIVAQEILDALGPNAAELAAEGYTSYGLAIESISLADGDVVIEWTVQATGTDGQRYDLSETFANLASLNAVYTVYAKAGLADTIWTKIGETTVIGGSALPNMTISQVANSYQFFKVIFSARPAAKTLAD